MLYDLLPLIAPAVLLLVALLALFWSGQRPGPLVRLTEGAALMALAAAILSTALLVLGSPDIAPQPDAVSATMLVLVTFIGWVVLRYSVTYLDGETRHGVFLGWMCATLATVLLLVQAGNLILLVVAWIAMSLCLQRLLLFYGDRIQAIRVGRKKSVVARIGDGALIGAAILLYMGYGMIDIHAVLAAARDGVIPGSVVWHCFRWRCCTLLPTRSTRPMPSWLPERR